MRPAPDGRPQKRKGIFGRRMCGISRTAPIFAGKCGPYALLHDLVLQRDELPRLADTTQRPVGAGGTRTRTLHHPPYAHPGDRSGKNGHGSACPQLCGPFRLCRRARRHRKVPVPPQCHAAGRYRHPPHPARAGRCPCPVRCLRAGIHLLYVQRKGTLQSRNIVAIQRETEYRRYERSRRTPARLRRLYHLRQTQFRQQDQHLPGGGRRGAGLFSRSGPTVFCAIWSEPLPERSWRWDEGK